MLGDGLGESAHRDRGSLIFPNEDRHDDHLVRAVFGRTPPSRRAPVGGHLIHGDRKLELAPPRALTRSIGIEAMRIARGRLPAET